MRFGRYGTSHWLLRLGLGTTFVWIGIDMLRHPTSWIGFLPTTIPFGLSRDLALQMNGVVDAGVGILLIINRFPRVTALVAAGHLAAILIFYGVDAVTVRDVGLFGMALALLFWPQHGYRKHWWQKFGRRRQADIAEE